MIETMSEAPSIKARKSCSLRRKASSARLRSSTSRANPTKRGGPEMARRQMLSSTVISRPSPRSAGTSNREPSTVAGPPAR